VPDPVCEPAQVEERHTERADRLQVGRCVHTEAVTKADCRDCLALAFAEQEREVRRAVEAEACRQRPGPCSCGEHKEREANWHAFMALRATPGGEREEGGGR
jgi:hypothetical protein